MAAVALLYVSRDSSGILGQGAASGVVCIGGSADTGVRGGRGGGSRALFSAPPSGLLGGQRPRDTPQASRRRRRQLISRAEPTCQEAGTGAHARFSRPSTRSVRYYEFI